MTKKRWTKRRESENSKAKTIHHFQFWNPPRKLCLPNPHSKLCFQVWNNRCTLQGDFRIQCVRKLACHLQNSHQADMACIEWKQANKTEAWNILVCEILIEGKKLIYTARLPGCVSTGHTIPFVACYWYNITEIYIRGVRQLCIFYFTVYSAWYH